MYLGQLTRRPGSTITDTKTKNQTYRTIHQKSSLRTTHTANSDACRCRIEFWPHWISTRGVLIQRAVLRIQRIFHVELRPPRQGVIVLRPLRRIKSGPPLNFDPQVLIPRWIMTPGLESTLNVDPKSWFNIELWPAIGITIQWWIVTRGHDSTWNIDPGS